MDLPKAEQVCKEISEILKKHNVFIEQDWRDNTITLEDQESAFVIGISKSGFYVQENEEDI